MRSDGGSGTGRSRFWASLVVLAVFAVAVGHGLWTTRGLNWPFDEDLTRDIAQASTMAAGGWLADRDAGLYDMQDVLGLAKMG